MPLPHPSLSDRISGGIVGALVGDALGVPVEFSTRPERDADPVTGLRAFGTWHQPAGTWSDDGALLLCTIEALAENADLAYGGKLFLRWRREGYLAARGERFDIGAATDAALARIAAGAPAAEAGGHRETDNGNGSLMRILPVALRFADTQPQALAAQAMNWSAVTHRHPRSQLACAYYCLLAQQLLQGASPEFAIASVAREFRAMLDSFPGEQRQFERILDPGFSTTARAQIRSGGYVIDTLEAALWCLLQGGSFSDVVLRAVNLGGDTDTTACVAGGLAGVWLGVAAIPVEWSSALPDTAVRAALMQSFLATILAKSQ